MRRSRAAVVATAFAVGVLVACAPEEPPAPPPQTVTPDVEADRGAPPDPDEPPGPALGAAGISAGHPAAVEAGMDVLAEGGTAADAAVAAAFAVSVVEMFASGIGGGGAVLVVPADGDAVAYDYRETVPAGGVPSGDAGVPGFVAGLELLHSEHGALKWERLLAPAVGLARDGFRATDMLAVQLRGSLGQAAASGLEHLYPGGSPVSQGDTVVQADLARTLEAIAAGGAEEFHRGGLAASLATAHGSLDAASLDGYRVQVSEPPRGAFAGYEVLTASPALPGVAMIQMLQVAEALGLADAEPGSAEYLGRLASAWVRAAETVESDLGDPDFVDVPVAEITDPARNADIAAGLLAAGPSARVGPDGSLAALGEAVRPAGDDDGGRGGGSTGATSRTPSSETTHITVVDAEGTVVSMTNTLTNFWGSGQYVDGYFLNNQMVRFSVGAGGQNEPEPGRRSVSWGLPTVVVDETGRGVLGIGSPGGERIPLVVGDVIARWAMHGQGLEEAVAADRFYATPGDLLFENLPAGAVVGGLEDLGWDVRGPVDPAIYLFGSVQALAVDWDGGGLTGAADHRREADFAVTDAAP